MDLQSIVMTTFVLLQAEWSVDKGRELVNMVNSTHIIVHRSSPQESYYLYTSQEVLDRLKQAASTTSVQVALDLNGTPPTPLVDIYSEAENLPYQFIMHEDGRLVGFFDASVPPSTGSNKGGWDRSEAGVLISQSLIAEFPRQVELSELTSLLVSLSNTENASSTMPVEDLPVGAMVDIIVQARRGFVVEGRREGRLMITDAEESVPIQFKLRSTTLGPGQIRVLAFHNGIVLGRMTLTPLVVEQPMMVEQPLGPYTVPTKSHEQPLAAVNVQLPDLSLLIEETWVNGERALTLRITASDPGLNLNL